MKCPTVGTENLLCTPLVEGQSIKWRGPTVRNTDQELFLSRGTAGTKIEEKLGERRSTDRPRLGPAWVVWWGMESRV